MFYTKIVIDSEWFDVLDAEVSSYVGRADLCKESSQQKQLEAQQSQFYTQLTQLFQTQFASQSGVLNTLIKTMEPLLTNPQGFSPQALAAMRTQASEQNSAAFQNAQQAQQERMFALNGRQLPSGVAQQVNAELAAAQAANEANSQQDITLANEQQKINNEFNAANVLSGASAQMNPLGYAGQATNTGQAAFSDATQIQSQSFGQQFGSTFFRTLGGGLANLATLGIGGAAASAMPAGSAARNVLSTAFNGFGSTGGH